MTLTDVQVELLSLLDEQDRMPAEAGFLMTTTAQAAGRVMNRLTRLGLTAHDDPPEGWKDSMRQYCWRITKKGHAWVQENPDRIRKALQARGVLPQSGESSWKSEAAKAYKDIF